MTSPPPDVAAFIRARLDEREEAARAATPGPWSALDGGVVSYNDPADESGNGTWPVASTETTRDRADRVHIAANDPGHVLAWVTALRVILDLGVCLACDVERQPCDHRDDTRRALAAVWREHPDYNPAWQPTEETTQP